jgi:hypothetical protein
MLLADSSLAPPAGVLVLPAGAVVEAGHQTFVFVLTGTPRGPPVGDGRRRRLKCLRRKGLRRASVVCTDLCVTAL